MTRKDKIQKAVADYFLIEKEAMNDGRNLRSVMDTVASDHGISYEELRDEILDQAIPLGAG